MFETDDWQSLLDECLSHEVANLRSQAASALSAFFTEYYQLQSEPGKPFRRVNTAKCSAVVNKYTEQLAADSKIIRMGFSLAIGKCSFCSDKRKTSSLKMIFVC
jgi:hypothetical protein